MTLTLALVQPRLKSMDPEANIERCLHLARKLENADLVVFPELASSGHGFDTRAKLERVAEDLQTGPTGVRLQSFSQEMGGTVVCGVPERRGGKLHNSAIIAHQGRLVGIHRKRHLYGREAQIFDPGEDLPSTHRLEKFSLSVMICLDLGFVREFPSFPKVGVNIIAHPSNLSLPESERSTLVRPTQRNAYIVTANRIGRDVVFGEERTFTGQSMVISPDLRILRAASHDREEVVSVKVGSTAAELGIPQEA